MQRMSKDFEGAIKSYEQYRPLASKSMLNQLDQVILACKEFGDFDLKLEWKILSLVSVFWMHDFMFFNIFL